MGNIEHGFNACKAAHEGFKTVGTLPPLGSDAVSNSKVCLFNYIFFFLYSCYLVENHYCYENLRSVFEMFRIENLMKVSTLI